MGVAPLPSECRIGGREQINVAREHCALSGPRQTTTQTIAPADDAGPGGLDFARAAAVLTDAAAKAGAAIMAHFGDGSEVTLKDDNSPVTRADRDFEAIILAALARLAPDIRVVSEESCGDDRRASRPLLPGRSARWHQGVHPEAGRFHRQCRADRGRTPELRAGLCTGARASGGDGRRRQGGVGRASAERAGRRSRSASPDHAPRARARQEWPDRACQPLASRSRDGGLSRHAQHRRAIERRLIRQIRCPRQGRCRRLSRASARPWSGTLPPARPCSKPPEAELSPAAASRSVMARPKRACAIQASSPGACGLRCS